ncbi:MAG: DNA polymerase III subunit delta [Rhodospirillales bacterium]
MKVTGKRIDGFLRRPGDETAAVLLFGPDRGLVRERAEALARTVVDDPGDPFRVVETTGASLKADPPSLADQAAQLSLTGGRRVIWVREASDGLAEIFESFLDGAGDGGFVIVEAGPLGSRSALRLLFEKSRVAAAIGCYEDGGSEIAAVIRETLGRHGLTASPDAVAYLTENLGGDRKVTRSELEKLALYAGGPEEGGGGLGSSRQVSFEDAVAAIGDSAAMSVDKVAFAAAGGDLAALDRALERAYLEGTGPVGVLRGVQRHLQRVHQAFAMVEAGQSPDNAMKALKPSVIYVFKDRFRAQLRQWRPDRLAAALELLTEAEMDCKSTGFPAEAGCHRALMRVAQAARGSRRAA